MIIPKNAQPVTSTASLADLMRKRRKTLSMTQEALARKIGASRRWVMDAERGDTSGSTSMATLFRALDALDIQIACYIAPTTPNTVSPHDMSADERIRELISYGVSPETAKLLNS